MDRYFITQTTKSGRTSHLLSLAILLCGQTQKNNLYSLIKHNKMDHQSWLSAELKAIVL